jgi:hypothetical protein
MYAPGTVLGTKYTTVKKTTEIKFPPSQGLLSVRGDKQAEKRNKNCKMLSGTWGRYPMALYNLRP